MSQAASEALAPPNENKGSPVQTTDTPAQPFFTPPSYSMKEVHDAIPLHCFQRNTRLSLLYILRDFAFVAVLALLATQISSLPYHRLRFIAWATYTFSQGLIFTGLWELAHECGHQALSPSKTFSNTLGLIMHSFLLVPYHSWKFTHAQHHKATNNIEKDIAFVPDTKEAWLEKRDARPKAVFQYWDLVEDMPIVNLVILVAHQLVAWPSTFKPKLFSSFPLLFHYLIICFEFKVGSWGRIVTRIESAARVWCPMTDTFNIVYLAINNFALARMRAYPWWKRSHFYFGGDGPNFKPSNSKDVVLSTLGVGVMATCLWVAASHFGTRTVFLFYGAPWLWTNHWILTITFLQHTDLSLPYYPSKTWSFLRGCASTIDRDLGFIGRSLFHGAVEYHVLHHHASRIPFYHAAEATDAIKRVMGSHYRSDIKTPFLLAFWRNYTKCLFVEEKDQGSNVYFFGAK